MGFDTKDWFANFTAVTKTHSSEGGVILFHQIGLIYKVHNLTIIQSGDMEQAWINPKQLHLEIITPFVLQAISEENYS